MTARITVAGPTRPVVMLRVRHPKRMRIARCDVDGGTCERADAAAEAVRLTMTGQTATARLTFSP